MQCTAMMSIQPVNAAHLSCGLYHHITSVKVYVSIVCVQQIDSMLRFSLKINIWASERKDETHFPKNKLLQILQMQWVPHQVFSFVRV